MSAVDEEYINDLIQQLDDGDIEPEDVDIVEFVEDDDKTLTPALVERLNEEQVERYNELWNAQAEASMAERERELSREQSEKLEIIESATAPEDDTQIETVPFGDHEIPVHTRITGRLERKMAALAEYDQQAVDGVRDHERVVELSIDIIEELIADEEWQDREVWRAYHDRHGSEGLLSVVELVAEPARARREDVTQSFRGGRGAGDSSHV